MEPTQENASKKVWRIRRGGTAAVIIGAGSSAGSMGAPLSKREINVGFRGREARARVPAASCSGTISRYCSQPSWPLLPGYARRGREALDNTAEQHSPETWSACGTSRVPDPDLRPSGRRGWRPSRSAPSRHGSLPLSATKDAPQGHDLQGALHNAHALC